MSAAVKEGLPSYTPEEEKLIIRNKAGVPIGVKPHNKWTVRKVIVWVVITALGVLGWTMRVFSDEGVGRPGASVRR
ncbi:Hypothetical protein PFR_JS12-1_616 [Propionibacterium freudenreichii]|nr:Hypothetical protein PFR_JS12-1_616 [Propionibacterium freudenreichii]